MRKTGYFENLMGFFEKTELYWKNFIIIMENQFFMHTVFACRFLVVMFCLLVMRQCFNDFNDNCFYNRK